MDCNTEFWVRLKFKNSTQDICSTEIKELEGKKMDNGIIGLVVARGKSAGSTGIIDAFAGWYNELFCLGCF